MTTCTEIPALAAKLRAAWPTWQGLEAEARADVLLAWQASLRARRSAIVDALIQDTGRRLISENEFDAVQRRIGYWAERAPTLLHAASSGDSKTAPSVHYEHRLHPLGIVGILSPWNVPLLLSVIDAIPALLAGCAVLLKPSEVTPRFVDPLRDSVEAVPDLASAFELVTGDGEVGEAIVDIADAVCFTGSTQTGRRVAARAGARLIPAFLELGGKDPLIVLEGADLDLAVAAALRGSILNTGQACQSIERVYVHQGLYEPFVDRLIGEAKRVRLNIDESRSGHLGPFIDPRQAEILEVHLKDALARGATQHCGEILHKDGGIWCSPIVLTGVSHEMRVMRQESFAPVIPVMSFSHEEQAVELANDSSYGLSAAVIGPQNRAMEVGGRIHAGAVSINDCGLTTQVSDVEKDSFAESGVGQSRMGDAGLLRFLRKQALLVQTGDVLPIDAFVETATP